MKASGSKSATTDGLASVRVTALIDVLLVVIVVLILLAPAALWRLSGQNSALNGISQRGASEYTR
jgi:biopolymer transport protein ExbD